MGKGGTKFDSEAIGQRAGRKQGLTGKTLRKDMEKFRKTGYHPEIEAARNAEVVRALPERDQNRPHIFIDFSIEGKTIGRVVIEIFQDHVVLAAQHFITRCQHGASDTYQGSIIHKIQPELAMYGGLSNRYKGNATGIKKSSFLQHTERGAVSVSLTGDEFVITTAARALVLDTTHQVVGRVHKGMEVIDILNEVPTNIHDAPIRRITLTACGTTNSEGTHETLEETAKAVANRKETAEEAAARLKAESSQARDSMREALQVALSKKRKVGDSTVDNSGPAKKNVTSHLYDESGTSDEDDSEGSE